MILNTQVNSVSVEQAIRNYMVATNLDFERPALRICRGFMRRVMGITPPAQGTRGEGGALVHGDKKRGEAALQRDLDILFTGVKLKKKRQEQFPNVAELHRKAFVSGKRPGQAIRSPLPNRQTYHVDAQKLKALAAQLKSRIGRLASGWLSGADAVGATGTPEWVRRHGPARGNHSLLVEFSRFDLRTTHGLKFTAANTNVPDHLEGELERRIGYALTYAARALQNETNAILGKRTAEFNRQRR